MNDSEKQTIVFIPRNFIEKGTFMGGMFKIRNAIEGGILAVLIAVPVIQLPLSLTVRIIILCMTALPAAMISLIGIGGESISAFLMNALRFLKNRRVIYRIDVNPDPKNKHRIKKPRNKEPKAKKHKHPKKKSTASMTASGQSDKYEGLEGAKYGIYKGDKLIQTLTTDKNGYAKSKELEEGSYTVKEISAPAGFIVDATAHDVNVKPEETSTVKSSDIPQNNPISLILQKLDLETGEGKPQGNSSLANAEFTIKFYTELYGHYRIDEAKAPDGYLNEGKLSQEFDIQENGKIIDLTSKEHAILNQIIRGDLEFVKVSDGDLNRLANVPFSITSKTTGEIPARNYWGMRSFLPWKKHHNNQLFCKTTYFFAYLNIKSSQNML